MMSEDMDDPSPKKVQRKNLRDQIYRLKTDKRSGMYISDPKDTERGIFKAPADQQKVYRKNLKNQISELRANKP